MRSSNLRINLLREIKCPECEKPLTEEEIECPYIGSISDVPICCECECSEYHFTCAACEECEDISNRDRFLVVVDDDLQVKPGIYRIANPNYWASYIIGSGWLYPDALTRVGGLPAEVYTDYPCGHLCRKCSEPYELEKTA